MKWLRSGVELLPPERNNEVNLTVPKQRSWISVRAIGWRSIIAREE